MNLSPHFSLDELTDSDTATRLGIDNTPDDEEIHYLAVLCEDVLEPLRSALRLPIIISSGYRCIALNRAIGSKDTSQHVQGRAADIKVAGLTPLEVCHEIVRLQLPWEQLIDEGKWTHVSVPLDGAPPKRQVLTAHFTSKGVTYTPGLKS